MPEFSEEQTGQVIGEILEELALACESPLRSKFMTKAPELLSTFDKILADTKNELEEKGELDLAREFARYRVLTRALEAFYREVRLGAEAFIQKEAERASRTQ